MYITLAAQDPPAEQGRPGAQHGVERVHRGKAHAGLAKDGGGAPPRVPEAPPVVVVEATSGPGQVAGNQHSGALRARTRAWKSAVGLDIYAIRVRGPKP